MYLQITEAAKLLNMSRQWVHELINRGEISISVIAGRRLVLNNGQFKALRKERAKAKASA